VKILLDTHVLLWWLTDDRRLRAKLRTPIASPRNDVLVSAATVWEIAIKIAIGKLTLVGVDVTRLDELIVGQGFRELPVTAAHAGAVATLPHHHTDPFDRLLIAQARAERATIASVDRAFAAYDVPLLG
jgi:PIN domain nuclease of toxin-antitoxin system